MTTRKKTGQQENNNAPIVLRWQTAPRGTLHEFRSTNEQKAREVYASLFLKYLDHKVEALEVGVGL